MWQSDYIRIAKLLADTCSLLLAGALLSFSFTVVIQHSYTGSPLPPSPSGPLAVSMEIYAADIYIAILDAPT